MNLKIYKYIKKGDKIWQVRRDLNQQKSAMQGLE